MPVPSKWRQELIEFVNKWKSARSGIDRSAQDEFLGDRPFPNFVLTEPAASWNDLLRWLDELKGSWCFRGQREASWFLDTSLDRAAEVRYSNKHGCGYGRLDRIVAERELLFRFQQQAHQYISHLPAIDDRGSWLALMQHYGAPTRLLDWTKSPYVALYFSLADESKETCAVWAINLDWLEAKGQEFLELALDDDQTRAEHLNGLLLRPTKEPVIVKIDPLRMNERMVAQQGFFLCNLFHSEYATFNQIFMHMMIRPDVPDQPVIRQLTVGKSLRIDFLKRLRQMNIHSASLFPGLDGFGKSLKLDLEIKATNAGLSEE